MDFQILLTNLTNPTLLFFLLGIIAYWVKSDLEIPPTTSKFISLYLLFSIGFKGGQELAHREFTAEIGFGLLLGMAVASLIPLYTFFILKKNWEYKRRSHCCSLRVSKCRNIRGFNHFS